MMGILTVQLEEKHRNHKKAAFKEWKDCSTHDWHNTSFSCGARREKKLKIKKKIWIKLSLGSLYLPSRHWAC